MAEKDLVFQPLCHPLLFPIRPCIPWRGYILPPHGGYSISASERGRHTLAGTPITREPSGICIPWVTRAEAPMIQFLPICAPLSTTAPIPTRELSSMVQPCRMAPWPTVTPSQFELGGLRPHAVRNNPEYLSARRSESARYPHAPPHCTIQSSSRRGRYLPQEQRRVRSGAVGAILCFCLICFASFYIRTMSSGNSPADLLKRLPALTSR